MPFSNHEFDILGLRFLEAFAKYNLRPTDITLEKGDELFSYSFKVSAVQQPLFQLRWTRTISKRRFATRVVTQTEKLCFFASETFSRFWSIWG